MSVLKSPYFPWKLLKKFLLKSLALFVVIFALVFFVFRNIFLKNLETLYPQVEWIGFFKVIYVLALGASLILFIGFMGFVFSELLTPLGVLYARIKAINDATDDFDDEENLEYDDPGEWSEIETQIGQLKEQLRKSRKKFVRNRMTMFSLLSALPEGIVAIGLERRPIFYNQSFLNLCHMSADAFEAARMAEVIRSPEVLEAFEAALAGKAQRAEYKTLDTSGNEKSYHITVSPLRDTPESKIYGAVSIFQDVTELKRLEQVRIDFVANVSHELRTPLTSMKGYSQTLLEDIKARRFEQGEKYLEVVARNVDRLLALVGDLLNLSSLESGTEIHTSSLETRKITQMVLDQLEQIRQAKGIEIGTHFSVDRFFGDEARVQQVLLNLLQNALQYIPTGKRIDITWQAAENGVELHVRDNGPGIGTEHQHRIFERFYRVDRARTRDSGSTGLGLAIVKHIMQRHGGAVRVESKVGEGTEFICFFPNEKRKSDVAVTV